MDFIYVPHDRKFLVRDCCPSVIHRRAAHREQLALLHHWQRRLFVDHRFALKPTQRPSLSDKKSRSIRSGSLEPTASAVNLRQLTDLGMEFLDLGLKITLFVGATLEHLAYLLQEVLFPG